MPGSLQDPDSGSCADNSNTRSTSGNNSTVMHECPTPARVSTVPAFLGTSARGEAFGGFASRGAGHLRMAACEKSVLCRRAAEAPRRVGQRPRRRASWDVGDPGAWGLKLGCGLCRRARKHAEGITCQPRGPSFTNATLASWTTRRTWPCLAFQYDRALIARFVGRARRAAPGLQLRWALLDIPQLPLHMELHRLKMVDICRQLFVTFAPGAYVTPPATVVASLALLHLVRKLVRGYLVGTAAELKGPPTMTPFQPRRGRIASIDTCFCLIYFLVCCLGSTESGTPFQYPLEFIGDSFEPEVYWLITRSTCS